MTSHRLGLAAICLALAACHPQEPPGQKHLQSGRAFLAAGDLRHAQLELRAAVRAMPDDPQVRYLAGRLAQHFGEQAEAEEDFRAAIAAPADYLPAYAALARLELASGRAAQVLTLLQPVLQRHPDSAELLTLRGTAHAQLHQPQGALADAEQAYRLAPQSENAALLLAMLYRQQGRTDQARALASTAMRAHPGSADLHRLLADMDLARGDRAGAELELQQAIHLLPRQLAQRRALAQLYVLDGRIDAAQKLLEDAVRGSPQELEPRLAYLDFLNEHRSPRAARETLARWIDAQPSDADLQLALGELLHKQGATEQAVAVYRRVLAAGAARPARTARERLAAIDAERGALAPALAGVDEVLREQPQDDEARLLRAQIHLSQYDVAAALADARLVVQHRASWAPGWQALARAELADGDVPSALDALRAAAVSSPGDPAITLELARALAESGQAAQAQALLEPLVGAQPQNLPAQRALIETYLQRSELDAATRAVQVLERLTPTRALAPYLAARIELAGRHDAAARADLERALVREPRDLDALVAWVDLEARLGHADRAIARLEALLAGHSHDAPVHDLLGQVYLAQKDYGAAERELQRATEAAPAWVSPYRNLALAQAASGAPEQALATYQRALAACGPEPSLLTDLAAFYERAGRVEDAIREYELLDRRTPGRPLVARNLALMLVTYRHDAASLERARALTASFAGSDDPLLLDAAGWVAYKRGDSATALALLRRASVRAPASAALSYHLAKAELAAGQREQARAHLVAAIEADMPFAGLEDARVTLARLLGAGPTPR